jgi:hypothetical protein
MNAQLSPTLPAKMALPVLTLKGAMNVFVPPDLREEIVLSTQTIVLIHPV